MNFSNDCAKDSDDNETTQGEQKKKFQVRSAVDLQRLKLEKLMKNPEKPVVIPEKPKSKDFMASVPSFVRNVMGSSAGAGSGEFHVYRHLRRKEYARQKSIAAKSTKERLDEEYHNRIEQNRFAAESKTAKKRAKRLKKKQKMKEHGKRPKVNDASDEQSKDNYDSQSDSEDEDAENSADAVADNVEGKSNDPDPDPEIQDADAKREEESLRTAEDNAAADTSTQEAQPES